MYAEVWKRGEALAHELAVEMPGRFANRCLTLDSKHLPVEPFSDAEFHSRVERTRELMRAQNLDAVFLTAEPNVEYLAGFVTLFAWNSPSRPWYFLLPLEGDPVGIIPRGGRE